METLTIRDIARLCGVSISTVSRAINNDPTINENTRDRVMEVVRKFHYVPNNSARNLKMAESNTIALIVKGVNNPFFQEMFPGFQEGLEKNHYQFLFHTLSADADEARAAEEIAKEKRLKGIIFLGGVMNYPEVVLKNIQIPLVLCSVAGLSREDNRHIQVCSVSIDDAKEAYQAVDYLCKKGHRKIGLITSEQHDNTVGMLRLQGYKKALEDHGIPFDINRIGFMEEGDAEFTEANGYAIMNRLLKQNRDLTAVFVISDRMAVGAYRAIHDAGLRIPEDISVIGFDGIGLTQYLTPALTTIKQPTKRMVDASIHMLMNQIQGSSEKKHLIYKAKLLERESVKDLTGEQK